ncbi:MAG: Lrp/AsnC family transcriptional regulator [Alphaproteobacteria bacterium]|nr:Lrp/AsnC family transcriptional regulator [Alphaproteobacteria bacterium]MCB9930902.1 Lrp/AsnC family transcriptional regulator [Alphaproteobacteria bacterium]
MAVTLDELDRKILAALQEDATRPLDELAQLVGSSRTPVWNRIKRLRERGVIKRQVAVVDPESVGLSVCFFVFIRTAEHDAGWLQRFLEAVQNAPSVIEAHRLAGEVDYILKVRVPNARAYDDFYQSLIRHVKIFSVTSTLSMEEIKSDHGLPIPVE